METINVLDNFRYKWKYFDWRMLCPSDFIWFVFILCLMVFLLISCVFGVSFRICIVDYMALTFRTGSWSRNRKFCFRKLITRWLLYIHSLALMKICSGERTIRNYFLRFIISFHVTFMYGVRPHPLYTEIKISTFLKPLRRIAVISCQDLVSRRQRDTSRQNNFGHIVKGSVKGKKF